MRLRANLILLTTAINILVACAPAETPTPTPAMQQVIVTPAYADLVKTWFDEYLQIHPGSHISLTSLPSAAGFTALDEGSGEIMIGGLSPPAGWFATPLQEDGIVVIAHPDLRLRELGIEDLADIFTGHVNSWENVADLDLQIQPVIPLPGDEVRAVFESLVMRGQRFTNNALLGPTPAAMLQLVEENEGAIGFLPYSTIGDSGQPLRIDGILPEEGTTGDGRYPLPISIQAIAPREPVGEVRAFLAWIQSDLLEGSQ